MKKTGIWVDKAKAHLITLVDEKVEFRTVESEVEFYNVKGGSRSKTRWGPQQVVQDSRYLEREKHQLKAYFAELARLLGRADRICIFGPGETKLTFHKFLSENDPAVAEKVEAVETTDSMTENQLVAWAKEFYGMGRMH
ncbi:hypothetical protein SAMN06265375_10343 [Muriicola jejuensis]|uniref:Host attachment protein n=1 Tax=Muriicola jejuensis TaxID=504488 RepID=A0A6P0UGL1_9FLAO|nr:hypothetical protein [Muriicola jejuensis]NER11590.1 hypothetical protein [Muriicola jejuensis]SMP19486.1 hypothetical protein SAMN06265375_10343 [Muriicola jejuensis]